jgi:predicted Co/Zn/Cd cation transporter (cation efflux family)
MFVFLTRYHWREMLPSTIWVITNLLVVVLGSDIDLLKLCLTSEQKPSKCDGCNTTQSIFFMIYSVLYWLECLCVWLWVRHVEVRNIPIESEDQDLAKMISDRCGGEVRCVMMSDCAFVSIAAITFISSVCMLLSSVPILPCYYDPSLILLTALNLIPFIVVYFLMDWKHRAVSVNMIDGVLTASITQSTEFCQNRVSRISFRVKMVGNDYGPLI